MEERKLIRVSVTRCSFCAESLPSKQQLIYERAKVNVQASL